MRIRIIIEEKRRGIISIMMIGEIRKVNVRGRLVIALPLLLITNLAPPSKFLSLIQFKINLGE